MHYVLVLMAVALAAILVAIVFVAIGRGGEMAQFPNDYAPPEFGALAATDVALLKPPTALWGYHMQATDEALNSIALAISERDVRIASLERQLADLRGSAPMPGNARPPGPDPQGGIAWPGTSLGSGAGLTAGEAEPPARHARPADPSAAEGAAGTESTSTESTSTESPGGTGNAVLADGTRALSDPRAVGDAAARESATSTGSGGSGTGWPDHPDLPAPSAGPDEGGPGAHGAAPGSATAWPGWPGAAAQPPGPQAETRPEPPQSHLRHAASPRQQPDEEETW